MTYNLTTLATTNSFFGFGDFVHSVFPGFFLFLMLALWVVIATVSANKGFPQASILASFVCAVLTLPLVVAGLMSVYYTLGFFLLTGILSMFIIAFK